MVQGSKSELHHAELQQPRIKKDEEAVSRVVGLIQGWVNPFAEKQDLISISTAKAAPRDIVSDLMKAYKIREKSFATFKDERLENDPPAKKFHDPIKADRSLFGRIIVMAQGRSLQMEDILSHPLGPLPWALSTPDGLLRKTNKATLATTMQKNVTVAEQFPGHSASIVDGMNLVQRVKGDQATFGDVATAVLSMALREGSQSSRIDVVFDIYLENSIKNSERSVRGGETGHQLKDITGTQIVRQWKSFLTRVDNKTNLITFIVSQ
jgi:hypothetical protein